MRLLSALLASTFALTPNGEAQLLPAGEFAARDGRPGPGQKWRVDDARGARLAADLSGVAQATPVLFDYDHQTLFVTQHGAKAPAAGWITSAEWRDGVGLFAKVDWTDAAKQYIASREYRYVSPVIEFDADSGAVERVLMASLVNFPALTGMHPAVAQLTTQFSTSDPAAGTTPMNEILKALLQGLGLTESATKEQATAALSALQAQAKKPVLPAALTGALAIAADADEAAALAAVTKLKGSDTESLTQIAALTTKVTQLSGELQGIKVAETVDAAIAEHKLLPSQREWAVSLGKKDPEALAAFVKGAPKLEGLSGQTRTGGHEPGKAGANDDPKVIADLARKYQTEQLAAGVTVSAVAAVEHVMAQQAAKA